MTIELCVPSPDACLIGRHGHYCDEPIGHVTPLHVCACGGSWPVDLVAEVAAEAYLEYYTVPYLDAPEFPPANAIAAAVAPDDSPWRRVAVAMIRRLRGEQ